MKIKFLNAVAYVFIFLLFVGCSKDDEPQVCRETKVTMLINGELQTFEAIGRGIDLEENGYRLHLNFGSYEINPLVEYSFSIVLRYKKTGENIIEKVNYNQYVNNTGFSATLNQNEIQSYVETNTSWCFNGTFSGTFNDGNQQITISDAKISYTYNESFD